MTKEHKQKISESCRGITKNNGKIWVTNGYQTTRIYPQDFEEWKLRGYDRGKKLIDRPQTSWNKGLKAINDPRVARQRRISKKKVDN